MHLSLRKVIINSFLHVSRLLDMAYDQSEISIVSTY